MAAAGKNHQTSIGIDNERHVLHQIVLSSLPTRFDQRKSNTPILLRMRSLYWTSQPNPRKQFLNGFINDKCPAPRFIVGPDVPNVIRFRSFVVQPRQEDTLPRLRPATLEFVSGNSRRRPSAITSAEKPHSLIRHRRGQDSDAEVRDAVSLLGSATGPKHAHDSQRGEERSHKTRLHGR